MITAPPPYELKIRRCTIHAGRYRWDLLENGKFVQTSRKSYATHIEARRAALRMMERLTRKPEAG